MGRYLQNFVSFRVWIGKTYQKECDFLLLRMELLNYLRTSLFPTYVNTMVYSIYPQSGILIIRNKSSYYGEYIIFTWASRFLQGTACPLVRFSKTFGQRMYKGTEPVPKFQFFFEVTTLHDGDRHVVHCFNAC